MNLALPLLVLIQFGFSYSYPLTKDILKTVDPIIWSALRALATALFLFAAARLMGQKKFRHPVSRLKLMGLALFGVSLNQYFFIRGLKTSSPTDAAIMATSIPVWVFVGSILAKLESFSFQKTWGILFAVAGVLVLFGRPTEHVSGFLLLNGATYAVYVVWGYDVMKRENPIFLLSHLFIYGFLGLLLLSFFEIYMGRAHLPLLSNFSSQHLYFPMSQVVLVGTVMPYVLYSYCTKHLPATVLAMGATIQPPLTAFLDFLIHNTPFQPIWVVSGSLIAIGVFLTTRPFKRKKKA